MNLELSAVPISHVHQVVGGLTEYFETAAKWSSGRCTAADILLLIMKGQYQLWIVFDKDAGVLHGFFVTELRDYPQQRMFVVQHVVVDPHLFGLVESRMEALFTQYAKDTGCAGGEFIGRPGWKKRAAKLGFTVRAVVYEKMIDEVSP